jgi:hypothetical protein
MALAGMSLVAACHSSPPSTATAPGASPVLMGNQTGAADATSAVRGFLGAVQGQDLQAMGAVWGGPDGPARDALPQKELYEREVVMVCALKHDRYDIVSQVQNAGGGQAVAVNLFSKNNNQLRTFDVIQGPKGRWYVRSVDIKTLGTCGR